jgi:hypothetical protein
MCKSMNPREDNTGATEGVVDGDGDGVCVAVVVCVGVGEGA